MKQSLIVIYGALAILLVIAYFVGGGNLILDGLIISVNTAYRLF